MDVGIIGGTGPAGRGLAVRLGEAGVRVAVGSRDAARAREVVAAMVAPWESRISGSIVGVSNEDAASAPLVVLATPWDSAVGTLQSLHGVVAGKVVISMVNALVKQGKEMVPVVLPRGSMAATLASAVPDVKIAAAMHHLPASLMEDLDSGLIADVMVCADTSEALSESLSLIERINGLRPIDSGSLSQAMAIEAMTAALIAVNIRNRCHAAITLTGI